MNKYLPTYVYNTIYDIDFDTLYEQGKKVILFDLDNTIATYEQRKPTLKQMEFEKKIKKIGFKIYIISNNSSKRIIEFTNDFKIDGFLTKAKKPFSKKVKKYLLLNKIKNEECVFVGDQILTDIYCANNLAIDSILVKSINRNTEKWYTKINRKREYLIIKKLAKKKMSNAKEVLEIIKGEKNE